MPLPSNTHDLLYAGGSWSLPGEDDTECEGAKFHSPTPLFVNFVYLVPREWLTDAGLSPALVQQTAWLCGTCQHNLSILQQIYRANNGDVPWLVRREFGNHLRALVERGWEIYKGVTADG